MQTKVRCWVQNSSWQKKKKSQTALQENIYPHNKVVVSKASPRVIKLDPALMFKYVRLDGTVQLVHIQVELPAVLVEFCTGWWIDDGLTMGGHSKHMSADNMDMQSDQMFWLTWANWAAVACCNSVRIKVILYSYCTHTNYIKMKKTGWSYCPKLLNFTLAVQTVRIFSHQTNLFIHWPFSYWHYCLSVCGLCSCITQME